MGPAKVQEPIPRRLPMSTIKLTPQGHDKNVVARAAYSRIRFHLQNKHVHQ